MNALRTAHNLTQLETLALGAELNLSDGHARQALTAEQAAIVERLPALFREAWRRDFADLERESQEAFLRSMGQAQALSAGMNVLSCYSSSVAMDIVARCLGTRGGRVALTHPLFDNIPDLLRARGLGLLPLDEADLESGNLILDRGDLTAVFVTTPNNPTGTVLSEAALGRIASSCARRGLVLAVDACFRGFDRRAQYDMYALLRDTGVEFVVIEDTGKLWPTLELKLGFLAFGRTSLPIVDAFSDVLLSVSPVLLLLVREFAHDAAAGGYDRLHRLVAENRAVLTQAIAGAGGASVADPDSRISVARVRLEPGMSGRSVYSQLRRRRVHVLPGGPFYWADPDGGDRYFRVALGRDLQEVRLAAAVMVEVLAPRTAPVSMTS